ncbi:MAG: GatB/Yqey [Candidatus Woesebacteria bacterium GW2011_GWB1_39_10]|uniref:GatB/Yqey n=2 Tax=Candidatus Woeseibacteriota TaxID=1752722 RepID=A0A0G0UY80_9BACT|nr:MAG: GatB/Yqey [Candidatus Woesebacteria bacterium GW2011_GWB1_39_10]KKR92496.1 MAG: GatB/Yqey [Candidatus Woesebacteria bacterium GW2011_GWA1_41_13b]
MLTENITKLIADAMKAHDTVRLSTLKLLSSSFNYEKIAKQHDLTDNEELNVIRKQAKQRKDSIDAYEKAGRSDLVESEKLELTILQEFLPPEMGEEELNQLISDSISQLGAKTISDLGKVIGAVKAKAPSVEGGKIAELVKNKLS